MNILKKAFSLVLCLSVVFTMLFAFPNMSENTFLTASADEIFDKSGDLSVKSPTKQELLDAWNGLTLTSEKCFDVNPSVTAPYAIGKLNDDYLQTGEDYLNYIRYSAHLPGIEMTDELNEEAQYGAVVMSANNTLTHHPDKPADMSEDFFQKGSAATHSSNISCGTLGYMSLVRSVIGCMNDRGANNLATVGHRRWLLNPSLKYVGFGYAESADWGFVATKVFDHSREYFDYNFISWPPSGNCLNEIISYDAPFTITLNPDKFQTPQDADIKITVTRESDGKVWTFDSNTNRTPGNSQYMLIETSGYGISNCIIFRPDVDDLDTHLGVYTFSVSGIYKNNGTAVTLNYKTDFFDTSYAEEEPTPDPKPAPSKGDINDDGVVDKKDYALLKRYCFDTIEFDDAQLAIADINGDGMINKQDYALLKRYCFGTYVIE